MDQNVQVQNVTIIQSITPSLKWMIRFRYGLKVSKQKR